MLPFDVPNARHGVRRKTHSSGEQSNTPCPCALADAAELLVAGCFACALTEIAPGGCRNADWQSQLDAEQRKLDKMLKARRTTTRTPSWARLVALCVNRRRRLGDMTFPAGLYKHLTATLCACRTRRRLSRGRLRRSAWRNPSRGRGSSASAAPSLLTTWCGGRDRGAQNRAHPAFFSHTLIRCTAFRRTTAAAWLIVVHRPFFPQSLNVDLNERIVSREPASTSKPSSSSASAAAPAVSAADKDKAAVAEKLFFSKEEYERAGTNPDITMEEALKAFDKAFKKASRAS